MLKIGHMTDCTVICGWLFTVEGVKQIIICYATLSAEFCDG